VSDITESKARLVERLRSSGITGLQADRMAEASVRRVAEKINRGENPAPSDDAKTREAFKRRRRERQR
tara:strand:+ start:2154 stop:2357 length:204 start_codon:yes stop_codon:yes gene_type:complete